MSKLSLVIKISFLYKNDTNYGVENVCGNVTKVS